MDRFAYKNSTLINQDLKYGEYGHYHYLKRMGAGVYGEVYKAIDNRTNETVAVKVLFDIDFNRVFREVKILRAIKGVPNTI